MAVCDRDERVVTPLPAVAFESPVTLAETVRSCAERWEVEAVVVGVPLTRGGDSRGERRVAAVLGVLRTRLDLPIETCDERGTTQVARAWLTEAGVPESRHAGRLDSLAAKAILERLLSSRTRAEKTPRIDPKTGEW